MARLPKARRLFFILLIVGTLAGSCIFLAKENRAQSTRPVPPPAAPPDNGILHYSNCQNEGAVAANSVDIVIHADEIISWQEGRERILLLKGQVLLEHGLLQARFPQGVLWVDLDQLKLTNTTKLQVYADGPLRIQHRAEEKEGNKLILDLATRGTLKVHLQKKKLVQQASPNDPVYQRLQAARRARLHPAAPLRQDVPSTSPANPPPLSPLQRTSYNPSPGAPGGVPTGGAGSPTVPPSGTPAPLTPGTWTPSSPGNGSPPPPAPPPSGPPTPLQPLTPGTPGTSTSMQAPGPSPGVVVPGASAPAGSAVAPPMPSVGQPIVATPPVQPGVPTAPGGASLPPPTPMPTRVSGGSSSTFRPGMTPREFSIAPRSSTPFQIQNIVCNGQPAYVVTGGVILTVRGAGGVGPLAGKQAPPPPGPARQRPVEREEDFSNPPDLAPDDRNKSKPPTGATLEAPVVGTVPAPGAGAPPVGPAPAVGAVPPPAGPPPKVQPDSIGTLDIEADRLVLWLPPGSQDQFLRDLRSSQKHSVRDLEVYLAGNVVVRQQVGKDSRIIRADQIYYDLSRNVAVAVSADLEFHQPGLTQPGHLLADELEQLSPTMFKAREGQVFSSQLPAGPGLKLTFSEATMEEKPIPLETIYGMPFRDPTTGEPIVEKHAIIDSRNVFLKVEDVPVFYTPFLQTDANNPLGPLQGVNFGWNRIFGYRFDATWDMYDLIGRKPRPNTRWRLFTDYMSARGPALGTQYDFSGFNLFGVPSLYNGKFLAYGIHDVGPDILGGVRNDLPHPEWRERVFGYENVQNLPYGFSGQGKFSYISDHNYFEQYWKREFDQDPNQETFAYIQQQPVGENYLWSLWGKPNIRDWVYETEWLPRADGYLVGQSFLNRFTYNSHTDLGYGILVTPSPGSLSPPGVSVTDRPANTGRFDWMQDLSMPFYAGPVKLAPYVMLDLTDYTQALDGSNVGRVYGAGGVRGSLPLSKVYPTIQSDLFNLNGINHKIVFTGNYFIANSSTPYTSFPQMDRLNDDATDQSLRDIRPLEPLYNPGPVGLALATSPLYDPQTYAIRRLVMNRVDTLGTIDELQLDVNQRWQTKRGYLGQQHIVDWMTLDLSGTYFPNPTRDNFGSSLAFLQYNWNWNVGDRTALVSTGWFDPIQNGARVWTIGSYLNRPDRTSFYLGYRQLDPLDSKLVTGSVNYIFSPKYAMTASINYDVASQVQTNSIILTRMGSDLLASIGFTYNSTTNNFSAMLMIIPNLVPQNKLMPGMLGSGSALSR